MQSDQKDGGEFERLQLENMQRRGRSKMWWEVTPADAVDIQLPHPDVQGPYNENGEECPWPWEPIQLVGVPLGQYRCKYCFAMVVAGMEHIDYGKIDENGMSWLDRSYAEYQRILESGS